MKQFDFSGYATKNDIRCKDGRVIKRDAFKGDNGIKVPLVWQHMHNSNENVLGHAVLENRDDGVYCRGVLNNTPQGKAAKEQLKNGDIDKLSIYANNLVEKNKNVLHGEIKEISLVLSGANPGATIDYVNILHSDGIEEVSDDEAIIMNGMTLDETFDPIQHEDPEEEEEKTEDEPEDDDEEDDDEKTLGDAFKEVMDDLDEDEQDIVYTVIDKALNGDDVEHSDISTEQTKTLFKDFESIVDEMDEDSRDVVLEILDSAVQHSGITYDDIQFEEDENSMRNVFENNNEVVQNENVISHSDMIGLMNDARKDHSTMKAALFAYAEEKGIIEHADYGIENIEVLFPDAVNLDGQPQFIQRDNEWVAKVLDGAVHSPISRIKTIIANITEDEARAKGYVKGNEKFDEVFPVFSRTTTPTTIYKKQRLDRDDIVDIDWDVVAWMRGEMMVMLKEELARAILIGDGRGASHPDKINELNIRPIATDDNVYATKVVLASDATPLELTEEIIRGKKHYKGGGQPTFFTGIDLLTDLLLIKEEVGSNKKLYGGAEEAAKQLRVKEFVEVEQLDGAKITINVDGESKEVELLGIMVNMNNYTIGATKGGQITTFDDFDIDFNQNKYLIETRCSGMLRVPKSAVIFCREI